MNEKLQLCYMLGRKGDGALPVSAGRTQFKGSGKVLLWRVMLEVRFRQRAGL